MLCSNTLLVQISKFFLNIQIDKNHTLPFVLSYSSNYYSTKTNTHRYIIRISSHSRSHLLDVKQISQFRQTSSCLFFRLCSCSYLGLVRSSSLNLVLDTFNRSSRIDIKERLRILIRLIYPFFFFSERYLQFCFIVMQIRLSYNHYGEYTYDHILLKSKLLLSVVLNKLCTNLPYKRKTNMVVDST